MSPDSISVAARRANLAAASSSLTKYEAAVLADKPTVYYRMNQKAGTTLLDSSGNNHPATLFGSISMGHTPLIAGDSTAASSSFANGYALESVTWPQQAVTAECWIRPTAADLTSAAFPRLLGNGWTDHDGKGFMLWLSQGHAAFNTGWNTLLGTETLKAGSVYHLVGTFTASSPDINLYVNGSLVARSTYGYVPTPQTGDTGNTYFGVLNALSVFGIVDHFKGDMSDCAVYDQALSPARVALHYADGSTSATASPAPTPSASPAPGSYAATVEADKPLVYFRLNQKSGTTLADSSGNGHPATTWGTVEMGHRAIIKDDPSAASTSFTDGSAFESATWPDEAITAECWIRPTATDRTATQNPRILDNAWTDHDAKGFMLWLKAGHVAFSTGASTVESPVTVQAGQAYYVAGTFKVGSPDIDLYVNGDISAKGTYASVPTPQTGDTANTFLGALFAQSAYVHHFKGDMSDCAIYDHALAGAQIHNHYEVGAGAGSATPSPSPSPKPTSSPTPSATATPTPSATATPNPTGTSITYNATNACIDGKLYTNNVLPAGVGEFATNGLNRSFWGGTKTRTVGTFAGSWGPGFLTSWGRHQYDTYFGDSSDGTGYDPFSVVTDSAVSGSPKALRIEAMPMPAPIATSLTVMANDQWVVTSASSSFSVPSQGGSLTVNVSNPNAAQNGWHVGMGYQGGAITFIGTLTSGGATPSGNGAGGSNPWTISNIHVYSGNPGTTVTPGSNDEGGFRSYNFPQYYSGTLDTNVNQQYGFFVARIRLPQPAPGLSPAWWLLETGGVGTNGGQLLRSEYDIEEQFGADYGTQLNAGNILWNSGGHSYGCGLNCPAANNTTGPGATGVYPWPSTSSGNYYTAYHDYGVLVEPGGPQFPTNYSSGGGDYVERNSPTVGTTFFVDGVPIAGHTGQPDLTQGSPDKEIMLMFQVGSPGSWLDPNNQMGSNSWPQYMYAQWLRAYKPTSTSCS